MQAFSVGWAAFSKDPESQLRDMSREQRVDLYAQAWAYYRDKMFSRREGMLWEDYLNRRGLYKHTRLIYNPVPAIVDFYVDNVWQPWEDKPEFPGLVTAVTDDTDEKLIKAIEQLDQWGMWLSESTKIKRFCAATGNVLIEGVDDPVRQKVYHKAIWPGFVSAVELNDTGDVQGYVLEYDFLDPKENKTARYKKIVTKEKTSYFRDDKPWTPPGQTGSVVPNIYGFVFAVWGRHTDEGNSPYGLAACRNFDKVDNVNSLASHVDDFIHRDIESPKIIGASGEIVPIIGAYKDKKTGVVYPQDPRLNWVVLKVDTTNGPANVSDLSGVLKLGEASPELERQLKSFENDYPELQAATIMKENSQLSGAALERMLGPAQNRLDGVQPNYNQQLIKLRQMQISVAGFRANGGGWVNKTKQHAPFAGYNLSSYAAGELDFNLKRSQLVHETEAEKEDTLKKKADRASTLLDLGVDELEALQVAGYTEEQAEEILARVEAAGPEPGSPEDTAQKLAEGGPAGLQKILGAGGGQPQQLGTGNGKLQPPPQGGGR
jgi:hypothetical protein